MYVETVNMLWLTIHITIRYLKHLALPFLSDYPFSVEIGRAHV